ncbi:hypothetical protein EVAR_7361_1, partial [Eumeta japonica]
MMKETQLKKFGPFPIIQGGEMISIFGARSLVHFFVVTASEAERGPTCSRARGRQPAARLGTSFISQPLVLAFHRTLLRARVATVVSPSELKKIKDTPSIDLYIVDRGATTVWAGNDRRRNCDNETGTDVLMCPLRHGRDRRGMSSKGPVHLETNKKERNLELAASPRARALWRRRPRGRNLYYTETLKKCYFVSFRNLRLMSRHENKYLSFETYACLKCGLGGRELFCLGEEHKYPSSAYSHAVPWQALCYKLFSSGFHKRRFCKQHGGFWRRDGFFFRTNSHRRSNGRMPKRTHDLGAQVSDVSRRRIR